MVSNTERRPEPGAVEPAKAVEPVEVVHRAAPRYGRFILTGLLAGAVLAFVIALATRGWSQLSTTNTFWLLTISLGLGGMMVGALVAYLIDKKSLQALDAELADSRTDKER